MGGLNNRHLFFLILEAGCPRSRCCQDWVSPLSLAFTGLPSHCVLSWPFLCALMEGERALLLSSCLLVRTTVLPDQGPILMTPLNFYYWLYLQILYTGVRGSTYEFWENKIQCHNRWSLHGFSLHNYSLQYMFILCILLHVCNISQQKMFFKFLPELYFWIFYLNILSFTMKRFLDN